MRDDSPLCFANGKEYTSVDNTNRFMFFSVIFVGFISLPGISAVFLLQFS